MVTVSIWQRFVTVHQEDQDLLVQEAKKWRFRPIISNYQGNAQAVITHPKGDARQFARSVAIRVSGTSTCSARLAVFTSMVLAYKLPPTSVSIFCQCEPAAVKYNGLAIC